jgi:SAM-dependent methyltransferase
LGEEYKNKIVDYSEPFSADDIARRRHRQRIGRMWAVVGPMQRVFLVEQGLAPAHRLLDVGCGPLRAGIHLVEYLAPAHYYGIDINATLLDAGYEHELPAHLRERLPRDHLRVTDRFDCDFGVPFDYAIAQSVFTHVSLNDIRLCVYRVSRQLTPEGRFFATFFEAPRGHPLDQPLNGGRRWTERNAFFYYRQDLEWAAWSAGCKMRYIGDWGHPRGQRMVEFRRAKAMRTPTGRPPIVERAVSMMSPSIKRPIKRALKDRLGRRGRPGPRRW